ncbi:MAG: macro domain-containing protein [Anaerolineales bacterium]|nr:macro domain-containing protein [Anaerolineales bacterium]
MIQLKTGNLLEATTEALVNTVNCVGVMGKGIALQFKQAFPENFKLYKTACRANEVQSGKMFITETGQLHNPRYIINFPTKRHWRSRSRLEDIESGLVALVEEIKERNIQSIAIPPLGCGNGGLDWHIVRPLIEEALSVLPNIEVWLYEPVGAPAPTAMKVAPKNLKMTAARALLIMLVRQYRTQEYRLTRLEIQKLAYFLQVAGQPLKLNYQEHQYGPYANNLNYILQKMEGAYLRGYGDGSQSSEIYPLPEAITAAEAFLHQNAQAQSDLKRVENLIYGYETPYSMELLASVHWVMTEEQVFGLDEIIAAVQSWNSRKRQRYQPYHIEKAREWLLETAFVKLPHEMLGS